MLNRWDASPGSNEAICDALLAIGLRGAGHGGPKRPIAANALGDHILTARMFLFIRTFMQQGPNSPGTGLPSPDWRHLEDIAAVALDSLFNLDPDLLLRDTATTRVTVTETIRMAANVTGSGPALAIAMPPPVTAAQQPTVRRWRGRRGLVAIALGVLLMAGGFVLGTRAWDGRPADSGSAAAPARSTPVSSAAAPAISAPVASAAPSGTSVDPTPQTASAPSMAPVTTPAARSGALSTPTRLLSDAGSGPLAPVAEADRARVAAYLLGRWTVQLDAVAMRDSATQQQRYRELAARYPALTVVNANSYASFKTADYWVYVSGETFVDADAANAWCAARELPADSCFARRLSLTGTNESNARSRT